MAGTDHSLSPRYFRPSPSAQFLPFESALNLDKAERIRQEIHAKAYQISRNSKVASPDLEVKASHFFDSRAATKMKEQERKAALQVRNHGALQVQLAEKQRKLATLEEERQREKANLALHSQFLDMEENRQKAIQQAKIAAYRQSLDLQLSLKKVALNRDNSSEGNSNLPSNLNLLAFELPELKNPPPFTYQRPKVVPTDPITFHTPRRVDWPKKVADYGKMSLVSSPFSEPVINKHSGVAYRDTRDLLQ